MIQIRPIPAAQVIKIVRPVRVQYLRVSSADRFVVNDDLTRGVPADDNSLFLQVEQLSGIVPLKHLQERHE